MHSSINLLNNHKVVHVAAAIIIKDRTVFCAKRAGNRSLTGFWEFPGGKVEQGEKPEKTVLREIKEELQADIIVNSHFCFISYEYPDFVLNMDCFLCTLKHGSEPKLLEHSDGVWADALKMQELEWVPADTKIVSRLVNYLQSF